MYCPCENVLKRYIVNNLRFFVAENQLKGKGMTLIEIAFIYLALKKHNAKQGEEIFIKLLLNLKKLPFVIIEKELAFIDNQ